MDDRTDNELITAARNRAAAIRVACKSRGNRDGAPELLDALADRLEEVLDAWREDEEQRDT